MEPASIDDRDWVMAALSAAGARITGAGVGISTDLSCVLPNGHELWIDISVLDIPF
jgi:hypothetical protein